MNLTELLDRFTSKALEDERNDSGRVIQGWVVAIEEVNRVSYVRFKDQLPTYNEEEARVLPKQEAANLMSTFFENDRELWRTMRLLPVRGDTEAIKGGMLPTIHGY